MPEKEIKNSDIKVQEYITTLQNQIEEKDNKIEKQQDTIEKQQDTIEHLNDVISKYKKMVFGKKSEKKTYVFPEQLSLFNEAETEENAKAPEPTEQTIVKAHTRNKKRTQEERFGELPHEEVILELEDNSCGNGHTMVVIGKEKERTEIEIIPEQIYIKDIYRNVYKCQECEKETGETYIEKPEVSVPVIKKSMAAPSSVAYVMQQKYQMGSPLYRQEKFWNQRGIELNRNTLANWVIKGSMWFKKLYEKIYDILISQRVIHADETTVRVLKKSGEESAKNSQMWVIASGEKEKNQLVWFYYSPTRSKTVVKKLFSEYIGILCSDAYSAYDSAEKSIHQCCMAHSRRRFVDCQRGGKADEVLKYMERLYKIEKDLKEHNASLKQISETRQRFSVPVFNDMFAYISKISAKQGSKLADAVNYALNHKSELATYLNYPEADIDNNRAERAIRPFTIARKNFLFCDTERGAEASAMVFTIIECAKLNNLDVFKYLKYLLETLPKFGYNPTDEQIKSVLPWVESVQNYCKIKCPTKSNKV